MFLFKVLPFGVLKSHIVQLVFQNLKILLTVKSRSLVLRPENNPEHF